MNHFALRTTLNPRHDGLTNMDLIKPKAGAAATRNVTRILGIDPGLANTGYGVIEHDGNSSRLLSAGCITTLSGDDLGQRLKKIHDDLVLVIEEFRPDVTSMEQLFFCTNVKTAISVAQGRGVAILATASASLELFEYTPLQIKQAVVGYGKATKQQVQKMVRTLLSLPETQATYHAADALAAALCHAHSRKYTHLVNASLLASPGGRTRFPSRRRR